MNFSRHHNQDICDAIIRIEGDGFSTVEHERKERLEWNAARPLINAHPDRMKCCPLCFRSLPIAEFLIDGPVRSIVRHGECLAQFVANVREWCRSCDAGEG